MNDYTVISYSKDGKQIDETYQPIIPELIEFIESIHSSTAELSA